MIIGDYSKKKKKEIGFWKSATGIFIEVLKDVETLSSARGRQRRNFLF